MVWYPRAQTPTVNVPVKPGFNGSSCTMFHVADGSNHTREKLVDLASRFGICRGDSIHHNEVESLRGYPKRKGIFVNVTPAVWGLLNVARSCSEPGPAPCTSITVIVSIRRLSPGSIVYVSPIKTSLGCACVGDRWNIDRVVGYPLQAHRGPLKWHSSS